jgi:hypothetical protein
MESIVIGSITLTPEGDFMRVVFAHKSSTLEVLLPATRIERLIIRLMRENIKP